MLEYATTPPVNGLEPTIELNLSMEKSGNSVPSGEWNPSKHFLSVSKNPGVLKNGVEHTRPLFTVLRRFSRLTCI